MEGQRMRIVRKPRYQRRDNPKARKVTPPPEGIDLARVAESCRYAADNPYHKARPGSAGTPPRHRPDASLCPGTLADCRARIERWLRDAVRAGHVGAAWEGGFPRYVWHREGNTVFEARQGAPGSGEYHGYPLDPWQRVRGLE